MFMWLDLSKVKSDDFLTDIAVSGALIPLSLPRTQQKVTFVLRHRAVRLVPWP